MDRPGFLKRASWFKVAADGSTPAAPLAKRTRITLAAGSTTPKVEDNIV